MGECVVTQGNNTSKFPGRNKRNAVRKTILVIETLGERKKTRRESRQNCGIVCILLTARG